MIFLVLLFLAVVFLYLMIDWRSLKHVKTSMRWITLSFYALVVGLWLLLYLDTDLVHPITRLQTVLDPLTAFISK